jgi:hypothetical protein
VGCEKKRKEKRKKQRKRGEREQRERGKKLRKEGILGVVKKINILKNGIVMLK